MLCRSFSKVMSVLRAPELFSGNVIKLSDQIGLCWGVKRHCNFSRKTSWRNTTLCCPLLDNSVTIIIFEASSHQHCPGITCESWETLWEEWGKWSGKKTLILLHQDNNILKNQNKFSRWSCISLFENYFRTTTFFCTICTHTQIKTNKISATALRLWKLPRDHCWALT